MLSIYNDHWCADMPQGTGAYPHRYVRTYIAYFRPLQQSRIRTAVVNVKLQNIILLAKYIHKYYLGVKWAYINNINIISCLYNIIA